jgi:hypothetical protein
MESLPTWLSVLLKILAMFLVILVGWVARRRAYLTAETTRALSRFVVDVTMPALIVTQMLRTVDASTLAADWYLPLLGGGVLILGNAVGLLAAPFFTRRGERNTFIFLAMVANWVYLPLPIVQTLYGDEGVRMLLLTNVGSQLVLWTLGVWTLRGGRPDLSSFKNLVTNPGLIATAVGILIALIPATRQIVLLGDWIAGADAAPGFEPAYADIGPLILGALYSAVKLAGDMTIPLSLIMTGAQLGELNVADHRPSMPLTGVIVTRLALAPVVAIAVGWLIGRVWTPIPEVPRMVTYIIACMPVAISCSIFTDRFGGDTSLAARGIFYSTLFSIFTVPFVLYVIQAFRL